MEQREAALLNVEQLPLDDFAWSRMMTQKNGPNQWSGRFWLPAGDRVDPTHKFCLIRGDGRLGEMIVDRFALGATERDVAVFPRDCQFA